MSTLMTNGNIDHTQRRVPFKALWLKRFEIPDWPTTVANGRSPLVDLAFLPNALDFLFKELPERLDAHDENVVRGIADAFGWICLALWQGTSPFPHPLPQCAQRLMEVLNGNLTPIPADILAIAGMIQSHYADGECGLNRLILDDAHAIAAHETAVRIGRFEDYLTKEGEQKFKDYQKHLETSRAFAADWALLKQLFRNPQERWPDLVIERKLRRPLIPERNWEQHATWAFDDEREQFRVAFSIFCWKWFLWAMDGDRPLLMKPSVNVTPYGTQIFVPGYMSLDLKRDLDLSAISRLHKARGVQRQSIMRNQVRALASTARGEGRSALTAVRQAFPDIEDRQLRRWLA
jgi:hypothetical protein